MNTVANVAVIGDDVEADIESGIGHDSATTNPPPPHAEREEMSEILDPSNFIFNWPAQPTAHKGPARDIFAEAREKYIIADLWLILGLNGTPKGSCKSPFRDEKTASFSIHHDGRQWTDHATGDGGDVIEFARHALGCDHKGVRDWFGEQLGIAYLDHFPVTHKPVKAKAPEPPKVMQLPSGLNEGTDETVRVFAALRGITYSAAWVLVKSGILRFCSIDGIDCYAVTDNERRAAEIRRLDGRLFGNSKQFHLRGVDKKWLPGAELLRNAPENTAVLITEGATDLISAVDLYLRYRKVHGGTNSWQPVALLGASCKDLAPECADLIQGCHVRLVPDADDAGDRMAQHWTDLLCRIGCTVDVVTLPRNTDLTDHLSTLFPPDLFAR